MKTKFFAFCILLATLAAFSPPDVQAQTRYFDDLTETLSGTDTAVFNTGAINGAYQLFTFETIMAKVSGTPSATFLLQGSCSGNGWTTVDTVFVTNVTSAVRTYTETPPRFLYYRLYGTTSGTQSFTLTPTYIRKEFPCPPR